MTSTKGLQFKKIDLHVHTPASGDYQGGSPTPAQIVQRALDHGLAAIAITDHQTAANVDAVKAAAKDKGLVVFPGVELMVAGGESGVHINLIFDVDKDTNHIHQFLNTLEVYSKDGKPTIAAETTVGKVADKLLIYDPSAVLILAHCHSSKGVTGDIKGETRTHIFQSHRKNILGAEANDSNFLNADLKSKHKRVIDVFDGSDKDYNYRKLGIFQASDAHTLDGIGTSYSWFKIDEPVTYA